HTHTHTHKHTHAHTQAQEHYLFALSTLAAQEHFPPGHLHCHNQCILYHRVRPILVSVNTPLLVNMFSLCVCDLCMYVCELYKCISYWTTYISLRINKVSIYPSIYLSYSDIN